jgi:CheY-like chemotaxis protein
MGKILLVEDDNNLREIYGARLMAEGYEIVSANDGEEALAIAVKEKPDLIIADVMMPRISGFDMLDILRNAPETKNTKIIMMTALSQQEDKEHAEKLGADKYLVKSQVTLEDVAQVVREILGESKGDQDKPDDTQPPKDDPPAGGSPPSTPPPSPDKPASPPPADQPSDTPKPTAEQKPAETPNSTPSAPTTSAPAASPSDPSQASVQPDKPESTQPAPPTQPAPSDTQSGQASNSTLPSAPAANDAAAPSSPPDNNSPIKSSISIPVVEPPADKPEEAAKPAEIAEQKPESTQSVPVTSSPTATSPTDDTSTNDVADAADKKDEGDKIGPNLAQALAEEEKQVKEQIDNFENKIDENKGPDKKPEAGDSNQQPTVISPTQPQDSPQTTPEPNKSAAEETKDTSGDKKDDKEHKTESPADSSGKDSLNPKKKIIQPINDLSKKPDLAAMAAEEEKTAKVINQNVIAPENKPGDTDAKSDNKTSPHDISI